MNGESDDTSEGAPAPAHPHVRISARGVIGAHTHANTCLRSRCAGVAPSIEFGISTVIIGVVAAVSAAAAPLPVTSTVPLRLVLVAASVRAIRDRGRDTKRRVCPLVACSFAGACGWCPWGSGEPARSTFARIRVRL